MSLSYNPSNQGLKHYVINSVFFSGFRLYPTIHQTKGWNSWTAWSACCRARSLSYNPSNQGLKLPESNSAWSSSSVFILQSIKPRVETRRSSALPPWWLQSLSYNPSNQGLKLAVLLRTVGLPFCLYPTIHQTKGWNRTQAIHLTLYNQVFILQSIKPRVETIGIIKAQKFAYGLYPTIHQTKGWNCSRKLSLESDKKVFILQSIKPRVETYSWNHPGIVAFLSLSYNPSNQGLKLVISPFLLLVTFGSLSYNPSNQGLKPDFCRFEFGFPIRLYPTIHQTKGWNWISGAWKSALPSCLYPTIHQTKGWNLKRCRKLMRCRKCLYPTIHQTKGWNPISGAKYFAVWSSLYPTIHQTKGWNRLCHTRPKKRRKSLSYNPSNQGLKPCLYPSIH